MMNKPLLSIIVPVYKVEDYVGTCLQSILHSKGVATNDFEVIIVDDGTPDKSMIVVNKVCEGFDNVVIIEQENQGLSAARMKGLLKAKGDYIWFIDSDDWISDDAIATIFCVLDSKRFVDVIITPLSWQQNVSTKGENDIVTNSVVIASGKDFLRNSQFPLWAAVRYILNKQLFLSNPFLYFPEGLIHEDEYFYRVLLYSAKTVYCLKDPIYYYRQRGDSITGEITIRSSYDIVSNYKLLRSFCDKVVSSTDKEWFYQDITSFLLLSYKKNLHRINTSEFLSFKRKYSHFIWRECMKCKGFSIKEKIWISLFLSNPKHFT